MSDQSRKPFLGEHLKKEVLGLLWLATGIFLLLSLASFHSDDPSFNNNLEPNVINNICGRVGAYVADLFFQVFGLPALLIPVACLTAAWRLLKFRDLHPRFYKLLAFSGLLAALAGLIALKFDQVDWFGQTIVRGGGVIGDFLADTLKGWFNTIGAALFLVIGLIVSAILVARFSMVLFLEGLFGRAGDRLERYRDARAARREHEEQAKPDKDRGLVIHAPQPRPAAAATVELLDKKARGKKGKEEIAQETFDFIAPSGTYHQPPLSLLDHDGEKAKPIDRDALMMNARLLEKKLQDFGVEGEVSEVKPGPVVTMYEFAPAPGVKVSKIAGLSDDLSMALKAQSIRIVAPIPGRGVVGIEIPNRDRETVYLKEIIAADEFQKSGGRLPLSLGKDIFGHTVVGDLARMPHLLVAGATGTGKSVSINAMILSLLYRADPRDVRLIMIDPKMLELSMYDGIPHLLLPVVTNPKKATLALTWAVREMERRYKLMADKGVRNIEGYNRKLVKEAEEPKSRRKSAGAIDEDTGEEFLPEIETLDGDVLEHGHLPYIVVIVDELADLMMVAGREVEESIARLAQMARAAGIHLILATQRPSVDVITGLIKANLPTRISFRVFSRIDSRTILDSMGAEALLGNGDMLFIPPGSGVLQRVHGAFVSEIEVQRVVDFLKKQGSPDYDKSILDAPAASGSGSGSEDEDGYDEKWDEALAIIAESRQASISMLQRRLRLGYNRAARMIEKMEAEGIVGPSDGTSRPREVFIPRMNSE
jgi:S-DNA-T family DNA segregation ATPase FtsK/SpoIIIE